MTAIVKGIGLEKTFKLGKSYVHALRGIDIEINAKDYIALMGPSGSGKTTLLYILGALDRQTKGEVLFEGEALSKLSEKKLAEIRSEKIGFVFQMFYLVPTMTAFSNVLLPLTFARKRKLKNELEHAKALLKLVGLEGREHRKPNELSGGEMQRVAIARALVNDPVLLLCDEPTGNLDSKTTEELMATFDNLNDIGKTIFIVTHNEAVANYCKKILKISDGKIVG
ncbi:MAG: ABC transporter ATP-binding protein [Candidatus Thermoplasmatota archaeon]|nr:ABC transporter ATP-binding protein [Candidatus Thermoplasmatota archaeon]